MNDTLSHSEAPLIQNDSPPSFKMNDNTNNNTYMNTNTNTTYNVARANDNKISSILAANKHIRKLQDGTRTPPTPLLPGGEELAVDELPYGISVPVAAPELHPFLVALIGIAREIGVEIRWHSLQDQLREAIGLWGESVIEKEFRDYSSFIKTLVNKNVRWDSFKKNRLDKLPTVKMLADVKSARQGKPVVSKPSVVYDEDAWQYMNAIKRGEVLRSQETLDILKEKMRRYADGSMKQVIIDFVDKFIIT
jgi:hypothetical protein